MRMCPFLKAKKPQYLNHTLLAQGSWQEFNGVPVEPSFEFVYNLPQGKLSLSASEAVLRQRKQGELTGTIEHVLKQEGTDRLEELIGYLGNWQDDLKTYTDLVNNYFLQIRSTDEVEEVPTANCQ